MLRTRTATVVAAGALAAGVATGVAGYAAVSDNGSVSAGTSGRRALLDRLACEGAAFRTRPLSAATPSFLTYADDDLEPCRRGRFPAFSITGPACALMCEHCRARIQQYFDNGVTTSSLAVMGLDPELQYWDAVNALAPAAG